MPDPRYDFLGGQDPEVSAVAENFYGSLPDVSWMQARGFQSPQGIPPQYNMPRSFVANPYAQAQKAYEDNIIKGFSGLDVTKPTYHTDIQNYFLSHDDPQAASYPRVQAALNGSLATHSELKQLFQKRPSSAKTYSDLVKSGKSPDEAISQLREQSDREDQNAKIALGLVDAGISREDLKGYQDKDGNYDALAAHEAMFNSKQSSQFVKQPLNDKEMEFLDKAHSALEDAQKYEPSDEEKKAYMSSHPGSDYHKAYDYLKTEAINSAHKNLMKRVQTLDTSNRAVSPIYYEALGMPAPSYQFNGKGKAKTSTSVPQAPIAPMGASGMPGPVQATPSIVPSPSQSGALQEQSDIAKTFGESEDLQAQAEQASIKEAHNQAWTNAKNDLEKALISAHGKDKVLDFYRDVANAKTPASWNYNTELGLKTIGKRPYDPYPIKTKGGEELTGHFGGSFNTSEVLKALAEERVAQSAPQPTSPLKPGQSTKVGNAIIVAH